MRLALILALSILALPIHAESVAESADSFAAFNDFNQGGKIEAGILEQNRQLNSQMTADIDYLAQLQVRLQNEPGGWLSGLGQIIYTAETLQNKATRPDLSSYEIYTRSVEAQKQIAQMRAEIEIRLEEHRARSN